MPIPRAQTGQCIFCAFRSTIRPRTKKSSHIQNVSLSTTTTQSRERGAPSIRRIMPGNRINRGPGKDWISADKLQDVGVANVLHIKIY